MAMMYSNRRTCWKSPYFKIPLSSSNLYLIYGQGTLYGVANREEICYFSILAGLLVVSEL